MAEPTTTIAIAATIIFCANAAIPVVDNKCGSEPAQKQVINLLVHDKNHNDIVQIETNGKRVYTLSADGKVTKAEGFNDDQAAKHFWMIFAKDAPKEWKLK